MRIEKQNSSKLLEARVPTLMRPRSILCRLDHGWISGKDLVPISALHSIIFGIAKAMVVKRSVVSV